MAVQPKYYTFFSGWSFISWISLLLSFTISCEKSPEKSGLTDVEGNVYDTVIIGSQTWMADNLRTSRLNDGTSIPLVESDTAWSNLRKPGYCWYGNYEAFFSLNNYGPLYNYYAVTSGKLCPKGWHVPDVDEWYTLFNYLGEPSAGGKMKETGTINWLSPNTGATNESGFNALPGGKRNTYYNDFQGFRSLAYFWASEDRSAMGILYNWESVTHMSLSSTDGASVRCIKDR